MKKKAWVIVVSCLFLFSLSLNAQLSKWILGNSQQNSNGSFYSYTAGNLSFYEADFSGATPTVTSRLLGTSITSIKSMGSQDVINNALDGNGNILFYLFSASRSAYNSFSGTLSDTVYFAALDSTTGKDEVFGKTPATDRISSVIEHSLCPRPGFNGQYYFIYKVRCGSSINDDIRYVIVDGINKTVSSPTTLISAKRNGEGFAISNYDCVNNRFWLFTTRLETNGFITLVRTEINSAGLSGTTDVYTVNLTNNSSAPTITAIEISSTGNTLAVCFFSNNSNKVVSIFDFDISTGTISNERYYTNSSGYAVVTCEFSPDGNRIYIMQGGSGSFPNKVFKCAVLATGSHTLTSSDEISSITLNQSLAMELAYDGKIYINKGHNQSSFYCITDPNMVNPTVISTTNPFFNTNAYRIGDAFPDQIDGLTSQSGIISITASSTNICKYDSVVITGAGGLSYQWSGGVTDTHSLIKVAPTQTTTYYLQTSTGNCVASDSITIVVDTVPVTFISGNTTICSGDSTLLTANGAEFYQWTGAITAVGPTIAISPTDTAIYTVTPVNGGCFGTPVSDTVNVITQPVVSIVSTDDSICANTPITITGLGGTTYQWSGGSADTTASIIVSPLITTTYYLSVSNQICVDADSIKITVDTVPIVSISGTMAICSGESTVLTASGANAYQWSGESNATSASITVNPVITSAYTVTPINGDCYGAPVSDSVIVTTTPIASITISDDSICPGESITIIANGGDTYAWSGAIVSNMDTIYISPDTTSYLYLLTSNGLCNDTDTQTVFVGSYPTISISGDTVGCVPLNVIFSSASLNTDYYSWEFGDGENSTLVNPVHTYSDTGSYSVSVIASNIQGCSDTSVFNSYVIVNPSPEAGVNTSTTSTYNDNTVTFYNSSNNASDCITYFGDGDSLIGCDWDEVSHTYAKEGEYTITQFVSNGNCTDSMATTILITSISTVYAPNAFTPNFNGVNDFFNIYVKNTKNFELMIFDRWGELIFETSNPNIGWDGYYKQKPVESGVYVWKLSYTTKEDHQIIGHVTVLR